MLFGKCLHNRWRIKKEVYKKKCQEVKRKVEKCKIVRSKLIKGVALDYLVVLETIRCLKKKVNFARRMRYERWKLRIKMDRIGVR